MTGNECQGHVPGQVVIEKQVELGQERRAPICGILSMRVAAQAVGHELRLDEILKSKYISDHSLGSTTLDLVQLAKDQHLNTKVYGAVDISGLCSLDSPALLHLKTRSDSKCGGHWVTFLGQENGRLVVIDSMKDSKVIRFRPSDLLTRWSGLAIQVSNKQISLTNQLEVGFASIRRPLTSIGICGMLILGLFQATRKGVLPPNAGLPLAVLAAFVMTQCVDESSIIRNPLSALWMTIGANQQLEEASFEEFAEAAKAGGLIDARTDRARIRTKIPNSKHVAVDLDIAEFRLATSLINTESPIVVFCNSKSCQWAELVGNRFAGIGYRNVKIFRRGVVGYNEEIANQRFASMDN